MSTNTHKIGTMVVVNDGYTTRLGQVADIVTHQYGTFHVVAIDSEFDEVMTIGDIGAKGIGWKVATGAEIARHKKGAEHSAREAADKAAQTHGLLGYYPEMGEQRPDALIDAHLGHYGKHYYITSQVELKGRGVRYRKTLTASDLTPHAQHKVGWHEYCVTERAFEKICRQYRVAYEMLL